MNSDNQCEFDGFAKVEVMGHQAHIGKVTTQAFGQAVMFRIDSPEIPEREEILAEDRWTNAGLMRKGSVVKHGVIPAATVLVGASSIYRITPCTEDVAIQAIISGRPAPLSLVSSPVRALGDGSEPDEDEIDDDEALYR